MCAVFRICGYCIHNNHRDRHASRLGIVVLKGFLNVCQGYSGRVHAVIIGRYAQFFPRHSGYIHQRHFGQLFEAASDDIVGDIIESGSGWRRR